MSALAAGLSGCASKPDGPTDASHATVARAPAGAQAVHSDLQTPARARIADALGRIKVDYVDPVEDQQLISGCRQGMLRLVPTASIAQQSSAAGGAEAALQEIGNAFSAIQQQGAAAVEDHSLANACVEGMVRTLDDRSAFLDTEDFRELQVGSTPVAGVGLELATEAGRLIVVSTIEGAPGSRVGLNSGDAIIQIDDTPIANFSLKQAIKLLRGTEGSEVKLVVERSGVQEPMIFVVKRELIKIESVKWASLSPGIAYIRITQFQVQTGEKLASAIISAYAASQRDLNGLVLDLRRNPGGLLNSCVAVSAAFLPKNALIVSTNGRTEDSKMRLYASRNYYVRGSKEDYLEKLPPTVKTMPMVVLVDHGSAACSEIVAAALQDHKRATIVGEQTYGLGTVQTIFPLKGNTALKLTTARYFRPNGSPMGPGGVTPDIVLEGGPTGSRWSPPSEPKDDAAVSRAVELLGNHPAPAKP